MKATRWTLSNTKQMSKLWVDGVIVVQPVRGGNCSDYARMEDINITSSCREGHKVNFVAVIACKTSNKCQGQQTTTESTTVQHSSFILLNNCEMG